MGSEDVKCQQGVGGGLVGDGLPGGIGVEEALGALQLKEALGKLLFGEVEFDDGGGQNTVVDVAHLSLVSIDRMKDRRGRRARARRDQGKGSEGESEGGSGSDCIFFHCSILPTIKRSNVSTQKQKGKDNR